MTHGAAKILEILFWLNAGLLLYVYVGYPVALGLLARLVGRDPVVVKDCEPSVTLLISAYNEKAVIEEKIKGFEVKK